jgi:hypothetical protein
LLIWAVLVERPAAQFQKVFAPLFSKSGLFLYDGSNGAVALCGADGMP